MFLKIPCLLLSFALSTSNGFVVPSTGFGNRAKLTSLSFKSERTAPSVVDSLNVLSMSEIKHLLSERGVDFRDCSSKQELIVRLTQSQSAGAEEQPFFPPAAQQLFSQEESLISTFRRVSPSVAHIKTDSNSHDDLSMSGTDIPSGSGSGFLWDNKGHVVTNFHVASGGRQDGSMPKNIKVKLTGMANALDAEMVGFDSELDLAVLKLRNYDPRNLPSPIPIGVSSDLQVGQSVIAIGNPFGLDDTLTTGVVSALGRDIDGAGGRPIHGCVQTDAAINPGNSGGPLLDSQGRLIGINTSIFSPNGTPGNIGIGFAIPVDTVSRVVTQLIVHGKVVRPTLGMSIVDDRVARNIGQQLRMPLKGCLVGEVFHNSPAMLSGLESFGQDYDGSIILGDIVTHIDGEPVTESEDLLSAVEERKEGDTVNLRVVRQCDPNRIETVPVMLTSRDRFQNREGNRNSSNSSSNHHHMHHGAPPQHHRGPHNQMFDPRQQQRQGPPPPGPGQQWRGPPPPPHMAGPNFNRFGHWQ
ncbi:unnamed protein product [Cylindrotheca closterium]|uniref:PDZ domain-containing protein n=1 Tax=Cylindrotheca closterium TaxID=2856 RepID=A0AAD2FVY1_9STRA|nr:unnamed protein product [Cylindrotheca closterium]